MKLDDRGDRIPNYVDDGDVTSDVVKMIGLGVLVVIALVIIGRRLGQNVALGILIAAPVVGFLIWLYGPWNRRRPKK